MPKAEHIHLSGVRQNNLRGFDIDFPVGKLTVVTGRSGAGKSSLVFDCLHAEGQRRYVETFSSYTRQFLEMLAKPEVDRMDQVRPSIALRQANAVRTSRSTVGTMTELTDLFKAWFPHVADLHDPDTGKPIRAESPESAWKTCLADRRDETVLLGFPLKRPAALSWEEMANSLRKAGYARCLIAGERKALDALAALSDDPEVCILQDRFKLTAKNRRRFLEAAEAAFEHGGGLLQVFDEAGRLLHTFDRELRLPGSKERVERARPALFSFNSPIGACPKCRGFGRVIEIDDALIIPDETLSLNEGAIKAFQGEVYKESLNDLRKFAPELGIDLDTPWNELSEEAQRLVMEGSPGYGEGVEKWPKAWYGVRRFFTWLEGQAYKMHVRVFLSKYRSYRRCPACHGARLKPEALLWKWQGHSLPELYQLSVEALEKLLRAHPQKARNEADPLWLAWSGIVQRLHYLNEVGLGYLSLDRTARTLSGGELQRVNLTACLGNALTETLFILDEPSIGLHSSDIDRLVKVLRQLVEQGNTVVVVEHDETVMRAADWLIEIGPEPGERGGELVFAGTPAQAARSKKCLSGAYLAGRKQIAPPRERRPVQWKGRGRTPALKLRKVRSNNLDGLDLDLPLQRLVAMSGVSGSGKSTLLKNAIYGNLVRGAEERAAVKSLKSDIAFDEVALVDQSPLTRTPRSNPALYVDAWDGIRKLLALTEASKANGFTASHFSFNSGHGRCEHCQGLGFEKVEMQFLADLYVTCPVCEGKRFKPEVLEIRYQGKNVSEILALDATSAKAFFQDSAPVRFRLGLLEEVGLGYLRLGQPLNTLSGGEAQRLKLVKYLGGLEEKEPSLLLLDEPTTGLHREDIATLIGVLQRLVDLGHSLLVIEHQLDVLACADWLIELGPGAGMHGGKLVGAGTPEAIAAGKSVSAPWLREALSGKRSVSEAVKSRKQRSRGAIELVGAREHNLQQVDVQIPHREITVVTGVSGSGKSTLAFDILFAEGQRRFMESISTFARQYVEQLPKPDLDRLTGMPPTVAIEQRVTRGTRKSTVGTVTEVAQFLRVLYARLGIPHSAKTGLPLEAADRADLERRLLEQLRKHSGKRRHLLAPIIRSRKGHHQPLADWASSHGYTQMRCDGELVPSSPFKKLDRYREHDVEIVVCTFEPKEEVERKVVKKAFTEALEMAKGNAILYVEGPETDRWLSLNRIDPATGESIPELDPKHFSWNSAKGWCETCHGLGVIEHEEDDKADEICPDCNGDRLAPLARQVKLILEDGRRLNLPELLSLTASELIAALEQVETDQRGAQILAELLPEIRTRLDFLSQVGLDYLTLDRASATLSGGEAQRIRLAAQLGSNLSGVAYVLDEPSIGLHERDSRRLIESLHELKAKGNTLIVVEHDEGTMREADHILDLGPAAGRHGGTIVAEGKLKDVLKSKESLTARYLREGIAHPWRGAYRELPARWSARSKKQDWIVLKKPLLRNLKGDDLQIPLGRLSMVCGISGAGKSTLLRDLLATALQEAKRSKTDRLEVAEAKALFPHAPKPAFRQLINARACRHIIEVDQSPIGKTPRSTPATYMGAYELIREHFASLPEARMHGYTASTFSFNTAGGRCETCKGAGRVKVEMEFLPDTYVPCEDCGGRRFGDELEHIRWKEKSIADVLAMSFEEAADFFAFDRKLKAMLDLMVETGLGYLTLGQSSPTLSGGEAQRLKLVSELVKGTEDSSRKQKKSTNFYLLEEPTIGLHLADCEKLIALLHRLVDQGHTVVVIEHHLDLIREADYVVEIGPEGGEAGGRILYQGALEGLKAVKESPTAAFL